MTPSAVETLLFRARRAVREQLEGALTCGEAERSLSLDLDGRLTKQGKAHLRAHLRTCDECASLARRQRARRAALRGLGPLPVPGSIASWGGGTAAGTGIAAKVAAVVAAGAAAVGVGYEAADAVSEPLRQSGSAQAATGAAPFAQFAAFPAAGPSSAAVASTSSRDRLLHDPQFQPPGASVFGPLGAAPAQHQSPSQSSPLTSAVANPVSALGGVVEAVRSTPQALPPVRVPPPPSVPVQLPPAPALPVPLPPAPQLPPPPAAGLPPLPPLPVEPPVQLPPTPTLPVDPGLP